MTQPAGHFPWDDVREDNTFPTGIFHMRVHNVELGASQTQKTMVKVQYQCVGPLEYQGQLHFEYYVLGNEENPTGIVAGAMGTRSMKKVMKAAQVPPSQDINQLLASFNGAELLLSIVEYKETKGDYIGTLRNRISEAFRLGEREAKVAPPVAGAPGPTVAPPAAATPATNPVPAAAPPVGVPPAAPTPPAAPPAAAAPPISPAAGVAPVVPGTQPGAPVATTPAPGPVAPPPGGAEPHMLCTFCQGSVPTSQFAAHMAAHSQEHGL